MAAVIIISCIVVIMLWKFIFFWSDLPIVYIRLILSRSSSYMSVTDATANLLFRNTLKSHPFSSMSSRSKHINEHWLPVAPGKIKSSRDLPQLLLVCQQDSRL